MDQDKAFEALKEINNFILQCPTGWGKTVVLQFLVSLFLRRYPGWKSVIVTPRNIISSSFAKPKKLLIDGDQTAWPKPTYDLSDRFLNKDYNENKNKTSRAKSFLCNPAAETVAGRTMVCSHGTINNAMRGENLCLFDKVVFIVDECHHIKIKGENGEEEEEITIAETNCMGNLVEPLARKIIDGTINARMWLATATWSRGDDGDILPQDILSHFLVHNIPFDKYWNGLLHLETFQTWYAIYDDNNPFAAFSRFMEKRPLPTLVYCPSKGNRFLCGHKKKEFIDKAIDAVLTAIEGSYLWESGNKSPGAVINLTDSHQLDDKNRFILENEDKVAAIIAVNRMKEGGDWPPLRQTVDFCAWSSSATYNIQKFGRGTRDYPGKNSYTYLKIMPKLRGGSKAKMRELASESFGQLIASLVEASVFYPISTYWDTEQKGNPINGGSRLLSAYSDDLRKKILTVSGKCLVSFIKTRKEQGYVRHIEKEVQVVSDSIAGYIENDAERYEAARELVAYFNIPARKLDDFPSPEKDGVSVVRDIGFDEVRESTLIENMLCFCSSEGNAEMFGKMRNLIASKDDRDFWEIMNLIDAMDVDIAKEQLLP